MEMKKIMKTDIKNCRFKRSIGYQAEGDLRQQNRNLHLSMLLTEYCESNVKIVFNTMEGYKEVVSTIWGATEKFIFLHGGHFLPIESVAQVTLE
jgi:hypothetical protein